MNVNLNRIFSLLGAIAHLLYPLAIGLVVCSFLFNKLDRLEEKIDKVISPLTMEGKQ